MHLRPSDGIFVVFAFCLAKLCIAGFTTSSIGRCTHCNDILLMWSWVAGLLWNMWYCLVSIVCLSSMTLTIDLTYPVWISYHVGLRYVVRLCMFSYFSFTRLGKPSKMRPFFPSDFASTYDPLLKWIESGGNLSDGSKPQRFTQQKQKKQKFRWKNLQSHGSAPFRL